MNLARMTTLGIRQCTFRLSVLLLALLIPLAAAAHHSFAMYDQKKIVPLSGTVAVWYWGNPHCILTLDVAGPGGAKQRWVLGGAAVSYLERIGMHGKEVKLGDKISVKIYPARDGTTKGFFQSITLANGKTIVDTSAVPKDKVLVNPLEAPQ